MDFDAVIVGGGIAGLTSAAYLTRAGYNTLLCEKSEKCGGLVSSFERDGFVYDGGIRAMENSGALFPMLRQLGLQIEFVKNHISMGIEDQVIQITSNENIDDYQNLLIDLYPQSEIEIREIIAQIRKIMGYMEVQYSIDNPAFLDLKADREYFLKKIFPWIFKYALTVPRINPLNQPVVDFLKRYTQNQALLDIIAQHFFHQTPAFFALSYIKLYLDYYYPLGGTGKVVDALFALIDRQGGTIRTNTTITQLDPERKFVVDSEGNRFGFRKLIWAADQKTLYRQVDLDQLADQKVKQAVVARREQIEDKTGNDSIFSLYLGTDLDKTYFSEIASEHFFYTPSRAGESSAGPLPIGKGRPAVEAWLRDFFATTTYEIGIPVLRDSSLAPEGKTGLIVSVLFNYQLAKQAQTEGWYTEFKELCEDLVIETLDATIYPGIKAKTLHHFSATPLTIEARTGNTHGAITGWAFSNDPMPAESRLPRLLNALRTPLPNVFQAGQWTYSPSGLPISLITGKMAADQVIKALGKAR